MARRALLERAAEDDLNRFGAAERGDARRV
jgi:hypothetical protein